MITRNRKSGFAAKQAAAALPKTDPARVEAALANPDYEYGVIAAAILTVIDKPGGPSRISAFDLYHLLWKRGERLVFTHQNIPATLLHLASAHGQNCLVKSGIDKRGGPALDYYHVQPHAVEKLRFVAGVTDWAGATEKLREARADRDLYWSLKQENKTVEAYLAAREEAKPKTAVAEEESFLFGDFEIQEN